MAIPNAKKKILKAEKGIFKKSFATSDERESKQQEASIEILLNKILLRSWLEDAPPSSIAY